MRSSVRTIGSSQESICEPRCRGRCSAKESCSMPHDPARVSDTKAWMRRAATDLRAAAVDLAADPPVLDDLVFHCQQAVEKAMKSLLAWHDVPFGKTHNLELLGEACLRLDPS